MSHVQQNFIWLNYTWYKTVNIVAEVNSAWTSFESHVLWLLS